MSTNFIVYLIGYALLAGGVAYAMHALGLGRAWIIAGLLVMAGLGVVTALARSKKSDVADARVEKAESEAQAAG